MYKAIYSVKIQATVSDFKVNRVPTGPDDGEKVTVEAAAAPGAASLSLPLDLQFEIAKNVKVRNRKDKLLFRLLLMGLLETAF